METQTIVASALNKILHTMFNVPYSNATTTAQYLVVAAVEANQITTEQANRLSYEYSLALHW